MQSGLEGPRELQGALFVSRIGHVQRQVPVGAALCIEHFHEPRLLLRQLLATAAASAAQLGQGILGGSDLGVGLGEHVVDGAAHEAHERLVLDVGQQQLDLPPHVVVRALVQVHELRQRGAEAAEEHLLEV